MATSTTLPLLAENRVSREPWFQISLAQWSLNRAFFKRSKVKLDNLEFAKTAHDLGIEAIEYVNQFFKDKAKNTKYLDEMKKRAKDHGVKSLLIMCDGEGRLGDPAKAGRKKAVENHHKWADAAKHLGCHSIRVNAASAGDYEEQVKLAADGLAHLSDYAKTLGLNVIVENHGGLSSNGAWLAKVMKTVDKKKCGTLPDFGNFRVQGDQWYDRYQGVTELMPFAKAVSAKSHDFDEEGNETKTDYLKMMKIVKAAGYRGWVGIEYEGGRIDQFEGIKLTKKLLEKVRKQLA
ncbi:MAG: sugar phosphate isomerase/epimerase family protein [Planctomycetota bacterium]|nr:sugar phosphate isomerase/epimerase family protein [Planctomycetota bacterium]